MRPSSRFVRDGGRMLGIFQKRSPEDDFARRVMNRLRARGWPHPLAYHREEFTVDTGGQQGAFYLGNVFRDWLAYPRSERAHQLDRAISFLFEPLDDSTFEAVADRLLPIVRNIT